MRQAVIVSAVRTPLGAFNGSLGNIGATRLGAIVIEEANLTPNILIAEVNRVLENPDLIKKMKEGAKEFAHPNAARLIAEELIKIAIKHEK